MDNGKDAEQAIPLNVSSIEYLLSYNEDKLRGHQYMPRASDVEKDMTNGEHIEVK